MREKWHRFRRLSGREQWLLVEAVLLFPVISIGLWLLGYKRWKWALEHFAARRPARSADHLTEAQHTARIVTSAARNNLRHLTCLEQSLLLWWFLRRRGIDAKLRIGGRKATNRFEAHAWVELDGVAFEDSGAHRDFVPFEDSVVSAETGVS